MPEFPIETAGILAFVVIAIIAVVSAITDRKSLPVPTAEPAASVLPELDTPTSLVPGRLATVQLVPIFAASQDGVTTVPCHVGLTDEDDAWIRRNWINDTTGHRRQRIWGLDLFAAAAQRKQVAVLIRPEFAPDRAFSGSLCASVAADQVRSGVQSAVPPLRAGSFA